MTHPDEIAPPDGYDEHRTHLVAVTVRVSPHQMVQYPSHTIVQQVRHRSDVHGTYHWHEFTFAVHPEDEASIIVLPKWVEP
jgi:hypothetical protein